MVLLSVADLSFPFRELPMLNVSSIAQSGMQAAQSRLTASASNVANQSTPGYKSVEVQAQAQSQPNSSSGASGGVVVQFSRAATEGVSLEKEAIAQMEAKSTYTANLQVLKTSDKMMGSLLDAKA
jgi:flagellar hook-associated protein FlgK